MFSWGSKLNNISIWLFLMCNISLSLRVYEMASKRPFTNILCKLIDISMNIKISECLFLDVVGPITLWTAWSIIDTTTSKNKHAELIMYIPFSIWHSVSSLDQYQPSGLWALGWYWCLVLIQSIIWKRTCIILYTFSMYMPVIMLYFQLWLYEIH